MARIQPRTWPSASESDILATATVLLVEPKNRKTGKKRCQVLRQIPPLLPIRATPTASGLRPLARCQKGVRDVGRDLWLTRAAYVQRFSLFPDLLRILDLRPMKRGSQQQKVVHCWFGRM